MAAGLLDTVNSIKGLLGREVDIDRFLNSPLRESTIEGISDDPTTMGFNIMFDFGGKHSPLFNEISGYESARIYLRNILEPDRAESMRKFTEGLRRIVRSYPYYFTGLGGMTSIYDVKPDAGYYSGRILSLDTLESLDMKISNLIEYYMHATWDHTHRREMLPINMRRFRMYVIASEIRGIRSYITDVATGSKSMQKINDKLSAYVFVFNNCEFVTDESHPWLDSMVNGQPPSASNKLKILVGNMNVSHRLGFFDMFLLGKPEDSSMSSLRPSSIVQNPQVPNDIIRQSIEVFNANVQGSARVATTRLQSDLLNANPALGLQHMAEYVDAVVKSVILGNINDNDRFGILSARDTIINGLRSSINIPSAQDLFSGREVSFISPDNLGDIPELSRSNSNNQSVSSNVVTQQNEPDTNNESLGIIPGMVADNELLRAFLGSIPGFSENPTQALAAILGIQNLGNVQ